MTKVELIAKNEALKKQVAQLDWTFDKQLQKKRVKFDKKKELRQK